MRRELLFSLTAKDFEVQTFRSGGKGGQHQNTTDSGVRIIHKASGAVGESRDGRSQLSNKKTALRRLMASAKYQLWHAQKIQEIISGKTLEQKVEEAMAPEKLKIEGKDERGRWTPLEELP